VSLSPLHALLLMTARRTALLIRCSIEEAEKIREAAKRERRTLSGYVLHAVMSRIASQANLLERTGWMRDGPTSRRERQGRSR
jgi:uncharacterized protein DUF1778